MNFTAYSFRLLRYSRPAWLRSTRQNTSERRAAILRFQPQSEHVLLLQKPAVSYHDKRARITSLVVQLTAELKTYLRPNEKDADCLSIPFTFKSSIPINPNAVSGRSSVCAAHRLGYLLCERSGRKLQSRSSLRLQSLWFPCHGNGISALNVANKPTPGPI